MSNNANLPATSTLLQKLVSLSKPLQEQASQPSPTSPRAMMLLRSCPPSTSANGEKTTVFHITFNTEAEFTLSSPDIDLGAISQLSSVENPSLIDMKLAYGERTAVTWLLPHVAALNASSGAHNRMDAAALALCCRDIILAYPYLTLAEFCIFCARMRSLRYVRKRSDYVFSSDTIMQGLQEFRADVVADRTRYDREHKNPKLFGNEMSYAQWTQTPEYKRLHSVNTTVPSASPEGPSTVPSSTAGSQSSLTTDSLSGLVKSVEPTLTDVSFIRKRNEQLARMRQKYPAQ